MKAEISKNGVLTIIPENETEEFALNQWVACSFVKHTDFITMPGGYYKAASIRVEAF